MCVASQWQLFGLARYSVVVFADADLELLPVAEGRDGVIAQAWVRAVRAIMDDPGVLLVADPDTLAPLNTGVRSCLLTRARACVCVRARVRAGR